MNTGSPKSVVWALALVVAGVSRAGVGVWIAPEDLRALPVSGPAWEALLAEARKPLEAPNLANQNDQTDVRVMAKALAYARTGELTLKNDVITSIERVAHGKTETRGRTLALCRGLVGYVIAADLVGLPAELDADFRQYIATMRGKVLAGKSLVSTQETKPNNWGTVCGASRAAIDRYLGDAEDLRRTAAVFKGWLGDRRAYSGFDFGDDLSWHADPSAPVGINPVGAKIQGHDVDGVLPDDQRRAGSFSWPPPKTNYPWGALQGVVATAVILDRAGMTDVWQWQDRAIWRAAHWLCETRFNVGTTYPAEGDDTWIPHVLNHYYGPVFPATSPAEPGKNVGWTDWTHPQRTPEAPKSSGPPAPKRKRSP